VRSVATVLIKKYGNRRLYDTGDSRYVTLDELATKIRSGADLRVVDAQTNEDLTQATLTQIVLETGHAAKFLPVQLLTQMIRLSDDALAEFFSRYVTGALDVYLQAKRGVQSLASYNPLAQIPLAATDALARMWMATPFASAYQTPYPGGYVQSPPPPAAAPTEVEPEPRRRGGTEPGAESTRADDVAAMRRELDELKQALREGLGKRGRGKRRP
jgi:polyhydroxyalkanoate synthesis repressor PhaR